MPLMGHIGPGRAFSARDQIYNKVVPLSDKVKNPVFAFEIKPAFDCPCSATSLKQLHQFP